MSNIGLSSLIKQHTGFGLLVHPQYYADKALTPLALHGVLNFCLGLAYKSMDS
jgi:hypothetical protein